MKLADLDWNAVLALLPLWERLSPAARDKFLEIKPGGGASRQVLGPLLDEVVDSGLVIPPGPRGSIYVPAPEARGLLTAMRAMHRHDPLAGAGGPLGVAYLADQTTLEEIGRLEPGRPGYGWVDRDAVAQAVSSVTWIEEFLDARTPQRIAQWEAARRVPAEPPRLAVPAVAMALRALVERLTSRSGGHPLNALADLLPDVPPEHHGPALAAGLRYLLFFVSAGHSTGAVTVGVLPAIVRRLASPLTPPALVAPQEVFEAPFRVADMTAVMVAAVADPLPIRGTGLLLYDRVQKALARHLVRVPAWVGRLIVPTPFDGDEDDEDEEDGSHDGGGDASDDVRVQARISLAIGMLLALGLVHVKGAGGKRLLAATAEGRAWLARGDGERQKHVLDAMRGSPQRNPHTPWGGGASGLDVFGLRLGFSAEWGSLDLREALTAALLGVVGEGVMPLDEFARHHGETANPFLGVAGEVLRKRAAYSGAPRTRDGWESLWARIISAFVVGRLVPLGGARLGRTSQDVGFALTDAGRYALGASDELRVSQAPPAEVVVQPDFGIVFLAPAPAVEAGLARFAERTGSGVGALFKLTRASILAAAEQGLTADFVLKTLGAASRTPMPANVARQVRDWFGSTRRVRFRPTVLIECPDVETATRVAALASTKATAVSRTILRFDGDDRALAALSKKLRAKGVFVDE